MASRTDHSDTRGVETTLSDEEWPVAEHYRVEPSEPSANTSARLEDERGAMVVQSGEVARSPARRFPPRLEPRMLAAVLTALLLIAAAVSLLAAIQGEDPAAAPPAQTGPAAASDEPTTSVETPPTTAKTVPRLEAKTLGEARSLLDDARLRLQVRRITSDEPRGEVLAQTPAAGSEVGRNAIVVLTVSSGAARVAVPGVVGLAASDATERLRTAGLLRKISEVPSAKPTGTVIRQVPAAGEQVEEDAVVTLSVATAPPTVEVPRLVGFTAADAKSRVRGLGLRFVVDEVESSEPEGTVIGQTPGAGSELRKAQTVTLRVSSGPAATSVPDVVGQNEHSARQQLEATGFVVEVVDEPTSDPNEDGVVLRQDPSGGASGREGSTVMLTVARFS